MRYNSNEMQKESFWNFKRYPLFEFELILKRFWLTVSKQDKQTNQQKYCLWQLSKLFIITLQLFVILAKIETILLQHHHYHHQQTIFLLAIIVCMLLLQLQIGKASQMSPTFCLFALLAYLYVCGCHLD